MNEKNLKILTALAIVFMATALGLLIVDYQLKNAVVEEANKLREVINGQRNAGPSTVRAGDNGSRDSGFPVDLVDSGNAGMEEAGDTQPDLPAKSDKGRPQYCGEAGNTAVYATGKRVGTCQNGGTQG